MTDETQSKIANKRVLCGILALSSPLWGGFGIHKFVLGRILAGILHLLLTFVMIGIIISVVEGIIYLLKSDEEFYEIYQRGKRSWL